MNYNKPIQLLLLMMLLSSAHLSCNGQAIESGPEIATIQAPETAEELADPPFGEIRKIHLRAVRLCRDSIEKTINNAPIAYKDGRLFGHLEAIKTGLDQLLATRKEITLINLVPEMAQTLHKSRGESEAAWSYTEGARDWVQDLFAPLLHTMTEYLIQQQGEVSGDTLSKFVTVFSMDGFLLETEPDGDLTAMWSNDLFVANPEGVTQILKAEPWQRTQKFIGGDQMTAEQFLPGYGNPSVNTRLAKVLGPKFLSNQEMLRVKFNDLKSWMLDEEKQAEQGKKPLPRTKGSRLK